MLNQNLKTICLIAVLSATLASCTKPREASLPDSQAEYVFSISDFGPVMGLDSQYSIQTDDKKINQTEADSVRAEYEVGKVSVRKAKVPQKLTYMFRDLTISGQTNTTYPITFLVDRKNVTAFKVVESLKSVSTLEKQYARSLESVRYQELALKAKDSKVKEQALFELRKIEQKRNQGHLAGSAFLIPIFKYTVQSYGILQRSKNILKEETSVLELKVKDWEESSHIMLATTKDSALPVTVAEYEKQDLDRTFLVSSLQRQIMTASELEQNFQISLDLKDETTIHTILDDRGLNIFELTTEDQLSDSELKALRQGVPNQEIRKCQDSIQAQYEEQTKNKTCVQIHRFVAPISFVSLKPQRLSTYGEETSQLIFEKTTFAKNEGLLMIPKFVEPARVSKDFVLDSSSVLRISNLKGKEFFFRRTLQDVPSTSQVPNGLASSVIPVRFEFEENRIVLRKTMAVFENKSGVSKTDLEEVMSIPVTYLREETKDSKGDLLAYPKIERTSLDRAQYIQLDWTRNTLAPTYSPMSYFSDASRCFNGIGNIATESLDNRLHQGILNFTQAYSISLAADPYCISFARGVNEYSLDPYKYQANMNIKERISIMLNDGKTDVKFGLNIPYDIQRKFHFGLFTNSLLKPDHNGLVRQEGTVDLSSVRHDFRNGRIVKYHVLGLSGQDPNTADILREVVDETIATWNLGYKNAFRGTDLERNGPYIQYEIVTDEQSVQLGDLDKNIIYLDPRKYSSSIYGITQVGYNPRSSVVVSDSLIIYAGNIIRYEALSEKARQVVNMVEQQKRDILKKNENAQPTKSDETHQPNLATRQKKEKTVSNETQKNQLITNLQRSFVPRDNILNLKEKSSLIQAHGLKNYDLNAFSNNQEIMASLMKKIKQMGGLEKANIEALINDEILTKYGSKLPKEARAALQNQKIQSEMIHTLKGKISAQGGCLNVSTGTLPSQASDSIDARSLLKRALAATLAHELGHSHGLTHNFMASFDKANYKNAGEESDRNYSSVMDYMETLDQNYDGLGPYDINALRVSHTGLAQAGPAVERLKDSEFSSALKGQTVDLMEIDRIVQKKGGWSKISTQVFDDVSKKYLYCSDLHVYYEPTCQRHDSGSSASEIVENLIKSYNDHYIVNYSRQDRLSFGFESFSFALGMTYHYFISLRQFTDEFAYKIIKEELDEESFFDYQNAAIKVINFFNSIALAETASVSAEDLGRFRVHKTKVISPVFDKNGKIQFDQNGRPVLDDGEKTVLVETKPLRPILMNETQLNSLGIFQDKLIALEMLTTQGFPHYKYELSNFTFNPIDIESQFLNRGEVPAHELISINTLGDLISGQARAVTLYNTLTPVETDQTLEEDLSLSLYSGMMAILNLETPSIKTEENFANLFKVGSSVGKQIQDRVSIGRGDIAKDSTTKVHYWPLDKSFITQKIIETQAEKDSYLELVNSTKLGSEMRALVEALLEVITTGAIKPLAESRDNENEKIVMRAMIEREIRSGQDNIKIARQNLLKKIDEMRQTEPLLKNLGINSPKQIKDFEDDLFSLTAALVNSNALSSLAIQFMSESNRQKPLEESNKTFEEVSQLTHEVPFLAGIIRNLPTWIELAAEKKRLELEESQKNISDAEKAVYNVKISLISGSSKVASRRAQNVLSDRDQAILLRKLDFLNKLSIVTNPELNR